jgi:hypothetical protein
MSKGKPAMSDLQDNLRLSAAARRRAHELRRETSDAYWSAATRFTRDRLRAAKRLSAALARHLRTRGAEMEV